MTRQWFLSVISLLLSHSSVLAQHLSEKLFFKDVEDNPESSVGSRRVVHAGEDVILQCEAAGRPSPTIYWEFDGIRLNPVCFCYSAPVTDA